MARSQASCLLTFVWRRTCSAIWSPTVNTGFRLVSGSWKIIAISLPRSACASRSSACPGLAAVEPDLARSSVGVGLEQAHDGQRRDALAGARLADDAQGLPARDRVVHAVDRVDDAVHGRGTRCAGPRTSSRAVRSRRRGRARGPVPRARWTSRARSYGHTRDRRIERVPQAVTDEVDGEHRRAMMARPGKNGHHQLPWGMNVERVAQDVAPGRRDGC